MSNSPLVTIIVPVYNIELYLKQCIESIITQSHKNIEILVVDDASTDGSRAIIEHYTKLDPRVKLLINKENQGLSTTRNTAMAQACGDFISFVDGDDWLEPNFIEALVASIGQADMAMVDAIFECEGFSDVKASYLPKGKALMFNDLKNHIQTFPCYIWAFLFRGSFVKEANLLFTDGFYYEDMLFFWQAMASSNNGLVHTGMALYHYRYQRAGAITRQIERNIDALTILQQLELFLTVKGLMDQPLKRSLDAMHYERSGAYVYFILYGKPKQKRLLFLTNLTAQWYVSPLPSKAPAVKKLTRFLVVKRPLGWRLALMVLDSLRQAKAFTKK